MRRSVLVAVLLSLLIACDDAPVTRPEEADLEPAAGDLSEPAGLDGLTDRELLVALVRKVDALEARLDREAGLAHAMVDSVMNAPQWSVLLSLAATPDPILPVRPDNPGGGGMSADIETILNRTDSIMDALYDAGAQQSICFDLAVPLTFGATDEFAGEGEIDGGVGVKVFGNGVKGAVKLRGARTFYADLSVAPAFNYTVCFDPASGRGGPAGTSGAFRAVAAGGPMSSDLQRAFDAMGLNASVVRSTLDLGSSLVSGQLDYADLSNAARTVWLPPAVQSLINDPQTFTSGVRELGENAVNGLCDTGIYPPEVRDAVAEACGVTLPSLQTLVTPVDLTPLRTGFSTLCGGFNSLLSESFSIPQVTIPRQTINVGITEYETFPKTTLGGQTISLFSQSPLSCAF